MSPSKAIILLFTYCYRAENNGSRSGLLLPCPVRCQLVAWSSCTPVSISIIASVIKLCSFRWMQV